MNQIINEMLVESILVWGNRKYKTQKQTNKGNKIKQTEQGIGRWGVYGNITNIFKEFYKTLKVKKSSNAAKLGKEKIKFNFWQVQEKKIKT